MSQFARFLHLVAALAHQRRIDQLLRGTTHHGTLDCWGHDALRRHHMNAYR